MIRIRTKLFNVVFIVACTLAFILLGCSPFDGLQVPTATATAEPTTTLLSTKQQVTVSPTSQPTCTVTTGVPDGYLNLRIKPGTQYAVIRVLAEGETLQVIARGAWLKVITREKLTGFVNARYCR